MNQATLDYIRQHGDDDVRRLALQGGRHPEVDLQYALRQIAGRQQARLKLPSWAAVDAIVYPPHLSMEQCSSELTARYKASVAGEGRLFVDLTAGFGVDMAFISPHFGRAVHVELQPQLCAISSENYRTLGLQHIEVVCGDGVDYLHSLSHADLLFVDPARRDEHGGRTYGIADCSPNLLEIRDEMLEKADRVLVKLSPMLDWRKAVADLGHVSAVHIVSVNNECKELLIEMAGDTPQSATVEASLPVVCVNLFSNGGMERFEFDACQDSEKGGGESGEEEPAPVLLYEPNASVMKAGCFNLIARRFGVRQFDVNSHLFFSATDVPDFPGRRFVVERVTTLNKRELRAALSGLSQANIAVRNSPMTVAELRKRLRLKDGGDVYIFATTSAKRGHLLLVCRKKS